MRPTAPGDPATSEQLVLDRIGGPKGFVYSTIPVVVFVTGNLFLPLTATISIAVAVAVAITVFRLLSGERYTSAAGGLVGVAVAAGIVMLTDSAKNYFLVGIWACFAGFILTLVSVLARWPVTGIIWSFLHGGKYRWRGNRAVLRAHTLATLAAATVLGSRFVVQQWLYLADNTSALGLARVAMGMPLSALVILTAVWAFRRSRHHLIAEH
ncbi:DUF3159 domain-containing protein [Mycolicibacterium baixiangningiae]|uniref:DUF3159 domain-containing protein n=1 Tax=Mycolicibacterium baixiangningiae TaxID=2761578 RepID=UPI0018693BC0|nr:DUF3159 domain-containing protein [Mycolicibacterium baixiangningiae]